jgi:hypothetical protein
LLRQRLCFNTCEKINKIRKENTWKMEVFIKIKRSLEVGEETRVDHEVLDAIIDREKKAKTVQIEQKLGILINIRYTKTTQKMGMSLDEYFHTIN